MNPFADLVHYHVYRGVDRPVTGRAYEYLLAGDGLFKRARNHHLAATIPLVVLAVAGLPPLRPGFELTLHTGRVPGRLLASILDDARRHACNGHEHMYQLRYLPGLLGARWRVTVPAQRAGRSRIAYQVGADDSIVCDLHSHHCLRAFFSGTDDHDEGGFRFYAVIGRLLDRPQISLRLGMYGDFYPLPAAALFEPPFPLHDVFLEDEP